MRIAMQQIARFLLVLLVASPAFAAAPALPPASVPGEVLVKIQAGTSTDAITSIQLSADIDDSRRLTTVKSGTIFRMHSRSLNAESLTSTLLKNPSVLYAEPNYIVHAISTPNDPSYSLLWGLKNTGQTILGTPGAAGADIHAEAAWGVTTGSASIVVGVVDTGVDYTHPDLAANIWSNPGGKGNAACAAGTHGFNAITLTCDPLDDHYHGTHVSGTIGAVGNNSVGVVGVNWTTSIMALKFLDFSGSGTTAGAIAAIDFAVQAKIDGVNVRVLSNSWGGGAFSKALFDEINKANDNDILFVAAAGNDGVSNDFIPHYPAGYATANMISVAATDNFDGLAYFSDYGPTTVHLGAPGVNVYSCAPGGSYQYLSGTSMATPHVSGVAALVLAQTPGLTTAQVKSAILNNTDPIPSLAGATITGGRLNAARALGIPPGPDFTITVSPSVRSVVQGGTTAYNVTITPSNGFAGSVDLAVTGLPTGASGTFNPTPATSSSTLSVTTLATTPANSSTIRISGTSGGLTHSASTLLTVLPQSTSSACPSFTVQNGYSTYDNPTSVVTADFNRDGYADVAIVSATSNIVSVLLGGGNGGFTAAYFYSVGSAPVSVAIGDFNGDGKPDLVVANSISNNVSILLGNGDGTFQPAVNYAEGTNPFWVAVGDFNGDGKPDIAVANNGSGNVSVLQGNGDGTFQPAANFPAGSGPFALAVGDFNGDGKSDLAVVAYNTNKISILLGNGDGSFPAPVTYAVGSGPSSLAVGDFNGDGRQDLVVSNSVSNSVSILLGSGDGTFLPAVNYTVGANPSHVAVLDADADGKLDVAVVNTAGGTLSILRGSGDGTFLAPINYLTDIGPTQVAVDDFNGDGKPDLIVIAYGYYYSDFFIYINGGGCALNCGALAAATNYSVGSSPDSLTAADFNGDGKLDLAVVNSAANNVSIVLGNGDGTFIPGGTAATGSAPHSVAVADFNRDGRRDLAVANDGSGDVSVLLGNGDGTFQPAVSYSSGSNPHSVAVGDFNHDGRPDLAVANSGSGDVSVLLNAGNGTFLPAIHYTTGTNPESVAIGDFNRDGKLDLAVVNSGSGTVSILLGNGDGTFQPATNVSVGTSPFFIVAADFNRDGKPDLAVANGGSNNVSVLLGIGDGTFHAAVNYSVGTSPYSLTVGDLNYDGALDLAVANHGSNDVSILAGNGDGTFALAGVKAAGTGPYSIVTADFNRDGKSDVAVLNQGSNNVSVLLNTCPVPDLTIVKTHAGTLAQGAMGKVYTITVTNNGAGPTNAAVTVTDALPLGLSATAMNGAGWNCTLSTLTCTRSDVLIAGGSYPTIALTVNVANNAPPTVSNTASVSGGGEVNTLNDSSIDQAAVTGVTDLTVTAWHLGDFTQGATARFYKISVRNAGGAPTSGTVLVADSLPAGLSATAMSGSGWNCSLGSLTCTRSDALAGGTNYPLITLTVNVAANAPSKVTNVTTVSGGAESNTANNTASDPTTIWSSQTCGTFGAPVAINTGYYNVYAIAAGDFNGDGKSDLAVVGSNYPGSISILMGDGAGGFAAPVVYAVGSNPGAIVVADLNHDGKLDLAVSNTYSNSLSILLGNGDGTFAAAVSYAAGTNPNAIVAGDFNGDGNIDFAVGNSSGGDLSILLGNGDGTLRQAVGVPAGGTGVTSIATADFDGDGKLDLAVIGGYYSPTLSLLRGNGDGTFQAPALLAAGSSPSFVAAGDFNGDGHVDLAVANYYSGTLSILIGNGDGSFQPAVGYSIAYGTSSIVIEDINGDGIVDLVLGNGNWSYVSVRLGNGDGTFNAPINYLAGYSPAHVLVGDFNGDGRADLVVTGYAYQSLGIMLGGCQDLTIAKTHTGSFVGGQLASYSLTVSNSAGGSSQGTVTVTDVLPTGLTLANLDGYGWNCDFASVTCTRNDPLPGGSSYPILYVVVSVSKAAPSLVTNTATVSGGGDTNPANNSASDPTTIVQAPDLTIAMTHSGTFAQGQTGRTYTITVDNIGGGATTGAVTVQDTLPVGLLATSMTGAGWNCNPLNCTRSDSLGFSQAYPPITLTVSVNANATWYVTNIAAVSGGGETITNNDWAYDQTNIVGTPVNVVATAISSSQIAISWDAVTYATSYQVVRSSNNGPYVLVGSPITNFFIDASAAANTTYLYRVQAANLPAIGPLSNADLATTIQFTNDPIVPGSTLIKAALILELRTAVNIVRAAAGLPPATFTDPSLTAGMLIKAVHVSELRSSLDAARAVFGLPAMAYTDPVLTAGTRIKAVHLQELRSGVK